tara:strand:+ start:534 stop:1187 length:654 start_codon:yes stop_codon:yes gene_type:complete
MNIEINVPTSLSEITLGQYQKYLQIVENNPDGNFLQAKMIEIFCGVPLSDAYELKVSSVDAIIDILNELLESKPTDVEQFVLNGITYGRVPDLNEMSFGEYIDFDDNVSKWEQMHIAMNVLFRPVKDIRKEKYNITEYTTANPEKMKDMPMSAVSGGVFFFLNLGIELSRHTILYSNNQEEMEAIHQQLTSIDDGAGINQFMDSLTEMLKSLKISLN